MSMVPRSKKPSKPFVKKVAGKRFAPRRASTRSAGSNTVSRVNISRIPISIHQVFPQSLVTNMSNTWTGFSAAANGNFPNIQFSVYGNVLNTPFNTGVALTSSGFTSSTGFSITTQYAGYSKLTTIYDTFVIRKQVIKIYLDTNGSDVIGCAIAPCANTPSAINYSSLINLPYSKGIVTNNNDARNDCRFSAFAHAPTILGLTKTQFECLPPVTVSSGLTSNQTYVWYGALSMLNTAGTNAGAITISITLESEVEWRDLIPSIQ